MSKRRYDHKKLARSSSLKKRIAMYLAEEKIKNDRPSLNLTEMLAYGHRPYVSYSDKELIKLFDENYVSKLNRIAEIDKEGADPDKQGRFSSMRNLKTERDGIELHIALHIKPIMDDLIEEAFSE
jgi:hypothetical protein